MPAVTHIIPDDANTPGVFSSFQRIVLAQGDSWFSIGAIPPFATSNLIFGMELTPVTCVVDCARPGATLVNMVDWMQRDAFGRMLSGRLATTWNAIFISGGGNDLINAIQSPAVTADGPVPQDRRLLLTPQERGSDPQSTAAGYVSDPGWQTFCDHLTHHFSELVARREEGPNQDVPLFFHTYDYLVPRNAPAFPGFGPWLFTAMTDFQIPPAQWSDLAREFIDRLAALLRNIIDKINADFGRDMGLFLVNTRGTLALPAAGSTGASGDWTNEIHPTSDGYKKLAAVWRSVVDPVIKLR
jgi:lysophospholipase L1-like esterase